MKLSQERVSQQLWLLFCTSGDSSAERVGAPCHLVEVFFSSAVCVILSVIQRLHKTSALRFCRDTHRHWLSRAVNIMRGVSTASTPLTPSCSYNLLCGHGKVYIESLSDSLWVGRRLCSRGEVGRLTTLQRGQQTGSLVSCRGLRQGWRVYDRETAYFRSGQVDKLRVRVSNKEEQTESRSSQQVRERSSNNEQENGGHTLNDSSRESNLESEDAEELSTASPVPSTEKETDSLKYRPRRFRNRFLGLVKLRSNISEAAESLFKSEIRRRICVTIILLMASRAGYFIPLPGFDRRFMPGDYLGFVSGAVEELGDAVSELKLSVFQLGISPYILSSIVMQVSCHLVPALVKLRKEGLDGNEKIKQYTWWLALGVAVVESVIMAVHSIPYSIYAAQSRFSYLLVTTGLLTLGAVTINWICEKITEAGFGQGSSLIICIGILTGYSESLYKMITNLQRGSTGWGPSVFVFLAVFLVITMWAVLVTEGRRKIRMVYYNFELAPTKAKAGIALPEVEPYIPFNINPTGMQPVLTTTYLMAVPSLVANFTRNGGFWHQLRDTLNPAWPPAPGAKPWLYFTVNALFIFIFNVLDIVDTPKEVTEYMMKIGARVPKVKPGRQTIEYLTKVQASSRFWGGILLAMLATVSSLVDNRFRSIHQGGSIGFTSMLIIVGSIIELRRSFMAYNVMPELSRVLKRYGA